MEHMIGVYVQRLNLSERRLGELEKELWDMGARSVEADRIIDDLRRKQLASDHLVEELRRTHWEDSETIKKLRGQVKRCDETIKGMGLKLDEASLTVCELKRERFEASDVVEGLTNRILAFEAEKQTSDRTIKEMELERTEASASMDYLEQKLSEASDIIQELRSQVLELETEKQRSYEIIKEMGIKQAEASRAEAFDVIQGLKERISTLEDDRHRFDTSREEMALKLDEANQTVGDLSLKNTEASGVIQALRDQILALEADKLKSTETIKEIGAKHVEANRTVDDVKVKLLEALQSAERFNSVIMFENLMENSTKDVKDLNAPVVKGENKHVNNDSLLVAANVDVGVLANVVPAVHLTSSCPDFVTQMTDPIHVTDDHNKEIPSVPTSIPDLLANVGEKRKISTLASSNVVVFSPAGKRSTLRKVQIQKSIHEIDEPPSQEPNSKFAGAAQTILPSTSNPVLKGCAEKAATTCDSKKQPCNSDSSTDGDPTESEDEDVSETSIYDLLASLRRQKLLKAWNSRADMLKDFNEDVYCLNAVCVLYRQKISTSESSVGSNGGFFHFDAMGGSDLAEYLIDGDPDNQLKKCVTEVIQERADVLNTCRLITWQYGERLFDIYCSGVDPFFKSR